MSAATWFWLGLLVFVSAAAYDWAVARYVSAAANGDALRAASWSALTGVLGLVGLLGILDASAWLAAPEVAGFFAGTYFGVVRHKR